MTALRAVNAPKSHYSLALIINRWIHVDSYIIFILINRFAQVYRGLETLDWLVQAVGNYYKARAYSQLRLPML